MSGIRSRLVAASTVRSAAFVSPWVSNTGLAPGRAINEYASPRPVAHEEAAKLIPCKSIGCAQSVGELLTVGNPTVRVTMPQMKR